MQQSAIEKAWANILETVDIEGLGTKLPGKVRDCYKVGDKRVIVVSDRISAFDRILGTIPFKGQALNQLAAFWFEKTANVAPNHMVSIPDPNVMVVHECEQIPLEFVVRGYITGVTKTSVWYNYQRGVRRYCGHDLPEGLRMDQKLERPILTPTTKLEERDRPISREEAIAEGLIDDVTYDQAAGMCFALFESASAYARERGIILVDTKYEIGRLNGKLVFTDEIHTPDSSRYWEADTYQELFAAGKPQRKLDKDFVREWLADQGYRGDGQPPKLPDSVRIEASRRYIAAYERITGRAFEPPPPGDARARVERVLRSLKELL